MNRIFLAAVGFASVGVVEAAHAQTIYSTRFVSGQGTQLVNFAAANPGVVNLVGNTGLPVGGTPFGSGLEFTPDGRLWMCVQGTAGSAANNGLYRVSKTTGAAVQVGPATGLATTDVTSDLAWNPVNMRMYMLGIPAAASATQRIYEVNLATGALTATTVTAPVPVLCTGLTINNNGDFFLQCVQTDTIYQVVGTNLVARPNALGFNANLNQGMGNDLYRPSGLCWYVAYNGTVGRAQLFTLNLITGTPTLVGNVGTLTGTTFGDAAVETYYFDCAVDYNRDGQIDFFDYLDFVDAFADGTC